MSAPEATRPLPPGHVVHVPARGEFFLRDSGGDGPPVLLLHGWMFASDLNWWPVYDAVAGSGRRVLAMDHRGHGRGLRTTEGFSLLECARDAATLLDHLDCGPVTAVGYSMGGPIAQLLARERPDLVTGLVNCATAQEWKGPKMSVFWQSMGALRFGLGLFPTGAWELMLRGVRVPEGTHRLWLASELSRGSSLDIAEAGRELSRYDAREWIHEIEGVPSASVITRRDNAVPADKQRALADALGARVFEVDADHMAVSTRQRDFRRALLGALDAVGTSREAPLEAVAG